ncbi:MAG: S8 family serine peptidase, partial [Candidatus Magasanikbacteria bacterium]|nr:S8 family serine peptidase [Candidatus Magasanikbacteria bacterium]
MYSRQDYLKQIGSESAWDIAKGKGVTVAVLDSGVDIDHPDLKPNVWVNPGEIADNGKDDDNNGFIDDVHGWNFLTNTHDLEVVSDKNIRVGKPRDVFHHATAVAGIIGGVIDNSIAGAGISQSSLMNLVVIGKSGTGSSQPVADAIRYAVDNGAHVINMSLVTPERSESLIDALEYAHLQGVVVVAAAGNSSLHLEKSPRFPICADADIDGEWVIGVSAVNQTRHNASFSNVGASCVDITAPGVDISSDLADSSSLFGDGFNGTSFATPFVSATAALILSIHPELTPDQVADILFSTVHKTPPEDPDVYEDLFGAGLLQIDNAVRFAEQNMFTSQYDVLFGFEPDTGTVSTRDTHTRKITREVREELIDVDALTMFVKRSKRYAVSVDYKNDAVTVRVYDNTWREEHAWVVPSSGKEDIYVADVTGDKGFEIILSPTYATKTAFRVFSLSGESVETYRIDTPHKGASVSSVRYGSLDRHELLASFLTDDGVQLYHFNRRLKIRRRIPLPFNKRAVVGAGDFDGDGEIEYLGAGGVGESAYVMLFEKNRNEIHRFYVASNNYKGGLSVFVTDHDRDGISEIQVSQRTKNRRMRVWSPEGKRVRSWYPFGRSPLLPIRVVPFIE